MDDVNNTQEEQDKVISTAENAKEEEPKNPIPLKSPTPAAIDFKSLNWTMHSMLHLSRSYIWAGVGQPRFVNLTVILSRMLLDNILFHPDIQGLGATIQALNLLAAKFSAPFVFRATAPVADANRYFHSWFQSTNNVHAGVVEGGHKV
jgi:hypothetical protein